MAGSPLHVCVPALGTKQWAGRYTPFKQTGDDKAIVRSSSDLLGKPGSVDRGNSPWEGFCHVKY